MKPYDFNSLYEAHSFYSVLTDYHQNCGWMKEETMHGLTETRRVLQLINDELGRPEYK